jgi:hypothetical protein
MRQTPERGRPWASQVIHSSYPQSVCSTIEPHCPINLKRDYEELKKIHTLRDMYDATCTTASTATR